MLRTLLPLVFLLSSLAASQGASPPSDLPFPPVLPSGQAVSTDCTEAFLKPPGTLRADVSVAKTPPSVDFMFFSGQAYPGNPWSVWGDSLAVDGKYYASIGDHLAPAGNAFVYAYDPAKKQLRQIADVRRVLGLPDGHYTPGKIHGRLDRGSDGWLYFSTHRGSTKVTTDEFHYQGDWILRCQPVTGQTEVVVRAPVPKHCIPCSVLDPERMIFYGGTAPGVGKDGEGSQFFAYDLRSKKLLFAGPEGPARAMIFSRSTGRVYFTAEKDDTGALRRFDPASPGVPVKLPAQLGLRAATEESAEGVIYTVSSGQGAADAELYAFRPATEQVERLGPASVGTQGYITSLDLDPTGRFLYYVPGAHGGSEKDGSPVVQFDLRTKRKKVIAFLDAFYAEKFGCRLKGTFSSAIDPAGDKLYITWNNSRGSKAWDSCVLTVIHLPASERE